MDVLVFKRPRPFINRTGLGDQKAGAFGLDPTGRRDVQLRVSKANSPEPIGGPFAVTGRAANVLARKVPPSTALRLQKGARVRSALLRVHAAALNFGSPSLRRHFGHVDLFRSRLVNLAGRGIPRGVRLDLPVLFA